MSIILCADDFAQNKEISQGILDLAHQKCLSAISCMTKMPVWPKMAPQLLNLNNIQCGLHFNLTHGQEPLGYWLVHSQLRRINRDFIRDTFNEQCDAFEKHLKKAPDFIDGHQHVHALPVIRDIIIDVIKERYNSELPWVRNLQPIPHQNTSLKEYILRFVTHGFSELLTKHQIPHNRYFAGIYSLKPEADFKFLLEGWLKAATEDTVIMCHPGLPSVDEGDPIREARFKEYQVLALNMPHEPLAL